MAEKLDARKIELIRRLKNLRDAESATIYEAAAAAAKLQTLLLEHDLEEATLEHMGGEKAKYGRIRVDLSNGGPARQLAWRHSLLHYIAVHNRVRVIRIGEYDKPIDLATQSWMIGERQNIDVVRALYAYLASEIVRLAEHHWPKFRETNTKPNPGGYWLDAKAPDKRTYLRTFYLGAVNEIYDRLKAQKVQDQVEHAAQWGLVVIKDQELAKVVENMFDGLSKAKQQKINDVDAYREGRLAARGINLDKQVTASSDSLALKG